MNATKRDDVADSEAKSISRASDNAADRLPAERREFWFTLQFCAALAAYVVTAAIVERERGKAGFEFGNPAAD